MFKVAVDGFGGAVGGVVGLSRLGCLLLGVRLCCPA